MTAAEIVDAAAREPVLVFGSLPPEGRDLDLLTRDPEPIAAALRREGFVSRGAHEWARFAHCSVEAVDLTTDWPHRDELLADVRPVDPFARLVRPSPAHSLLLLAQMLARQGRYPWKRVARMRAALAEDSDAAEAAQRLAPAWGVADELERVLAGEPVVPRPRPRRPRVIAVSGIDGSGKSTQARALCETLELLGYDAVVAWAPLGSSRLLRKLFLPVRDALGRVTGFQQPAAAADSALVPNPGSLLRERSPVANFAWSALVALTNGAFHARTVARESARGRVVIFDRYVLDSVVRLRFLYGDRPHRVQNAIVRRLSPRPRAAFFLDVAAESSRARKNDRWTLADLHTLVRLYREELPRDVTRLDGERPRDELCAEIAEAAWRRLG